MLANWAHLYSPVCARGHAGPALWPTRKHWTFVYWVNFAITPWWVYLRDSSVVSNVFAGKFWEIKSKMSLQILLTVTFASFQNYFKYKKFPLKIKTFKFQSDKHWSFRVRRLSPVTPSGPITVEHLRLKWNCRQSCDLSQLKAAGDLTCALRHSHLPLRVHTGANQVHLTANLSLHGQI